MDNDLNLERVSHRIAAHIIDFVLDKRESDPEFYVDELREYVSSRVGAIAPASPDRILRDLRQKGIINYMVVSRPKSLYRAL